MDKIKFGFSKTIKKPNLVNQIGTTIVKSSKIELIEAIEGTSIKITGKNPEDEVEKKLVIPMSNDQKTTPLSKLMEDRMKRALHRKMKIEDSNGAKSEVEIKQEPMEVVDESLEQQAARELIEDLQKQVDKTETKVFEVPMNPDDLPLEGAKESSMDDYDRVPIGDFGKAMLRGMGWKDEEVKDESKKAELEGPVLRPKGMGLGADKVIKKQPLLIAPNQSETLEIKRNACVKILAGKHKNFYGTIEGFDDGGGRIVIKLAIGGLKVTMNEFMAQPVSKQEFAKYGKILNSQKFEEFSSSNNSNNLPLSSSSIKKEVEKTKPERNRSKERHERNRSESRDRKTLSHKSSERKPDRYENTSSSRKYHGRSRSPMKRSKRSRSLEDRSYKKKSSKHKSRKTDYSSPDSRTSSDNDKKHKKKTKKSKHKRDRS